MRRRRLMLAVLAGLLSPIAILVAAGVQPPTVPSLLSAAAAYVAVYEEQASGLVFEERYEHTVTPLPRGTTVARRLRSEVVVLNTGNLGWVGFRDVFEVDDTPVRDRTDRLAKLFCRTPHRRPHQSSRRR